ncbi:hypothetical protein [Enterobacter hormaechei]|uniref:hypothetical protein n=1 Tax=Enterobacter hormaechei TaxID=158836 RepID=UPI00387E39B1
MREILISESAWEEMTCLFAPSLTSFVMELSQNQSYSALASIIGFALCVPLILLIFKKVR